MLLTVSKIISYADVAAAATATQHSGLALGRVLGRVLGNILVCFVLGLRANCLIILSILTRYPSILRRLIRLILGYVDV